jgi:hypothetical protein
MGMMLSDEETKLLYKLATEELSSYGLGYGKRRGTKQEYFYIELLKSTLTRIEKSVLREAKRKKRIDKTLVSRSSTDIENSTDRGKLNDNEKLT